MRFYHCREMLSFHFNNSDFITHHQAHHEQQKNMWCHHRNYGVREFLPYTSVPIGCIYVY